MNKKIYELKNQRKSMLDSAEAFLKEGKKSEYDEAMAKVKEMNAEIDSLDALDLERGRFNDEDSKRVEAYNMISAKKEAEAAERSLDEVLGEREYARAFAKAIRNHVFRNDVMAGVGGEVYAPLRNALTIAGGDPAGEDGGFLVPSDISTRINEVRRTVISLADLVNVENVTAPTGARPFDTTPTKGFTKINAELGAIPEDDQPVFGQIPYTTDTYGILIPISMQLVNDNDANLLEYLARWLGKKQVITENAIILAKLNTLQGTAVTGSLFDAIKTALNVTLDPAIAMNAKILTNQTGFNLMDLQKDQSQNYIMQDDVTMRTGMTFASDQIVRQGDRFMPNDQSTGTPFYIGDFSQFMTLFRRKHLEIDATNIGGNAWKNYGYEVRGITRLGATVFDSAAAAKLTVAPTT